MFPQGRQRSSRGSLHRDAPSTPHLLLYRSAVSRGKEKRRVSEKATGRSVGGQAPQQALKKRVEATLTNGQIATYEVIGSGREPQQKARLGKILSTRAAYGFDWNSARDGYVINLEQMAVLRRMFYMVGVEGRSLCAIQKELSEDGVPSPTGKAQWDIQSIRKLLKRDLYRPHTYAEMRELVAPDALARLEPDKNYGVYWFGERAETRKRVSENGESGRVYRHRYTSSVRSVADRVGVPVPDSGIPREWVDDARANPKNNRRPANAGRRLWDLSAGILHCSECGRCLRALRTALTSTTPVQ